MPSPSQRRSPMADLGLTRKPVFELFQPPAGLEYDPAYAPALRQDVMEDRIIQTNQQALGMQQRQLERDAVAEETAAAYFQQPPSARQRFLEDNPAIAGSQQFGNIAQYESMVGRPSAADQTLMRTLAQKLPVNARGRFYEGVQSGMGALNAFDDAEDFVGQEKLREDLYGNLVDDDTIKKEFPDGRLDAPRVARVIAQRKQSLESDPETKHLSNYHSMLSRQARLQYETTGEVPAELQAELDSVNADLAAKLKSKTMKPAPPVAQAEVIQTPAGTVKEETVVAPAKAAAAPVAAQTYTQLMAQSRKPAVVDKEAEEINQQWTAAKSDLEKKLDAAVPDRVIPGTETNQREAFARAIVDGEQVEDFRGPSDDTGAVTRESLADVTLRQIGLEPFGTAFKEKGNRRVGEQSVRNNDLLRAWAEDYLNQRGKLLPTKESPTGSKLTPEQQKSLEDLGKMIRGE